MKYILTTLLCVFCLNINFAQSEATTTRAERSQMGRMEQTKKSATKTLMVSLERYRDAVSTSDVESQAVLRKNMLMHMSKVISTNKFLLKEVAVSEGNKTKVAATKNSVSQQRVLLKNAENTTDAEETERLVLEFLGTL